MTEYLVWGQSAVRDRLVGYVAAELGDLGGVLIADETEREIGQDECLTTVSVHRDGGEDHELPGGG